MTDTIPRRRDRAAGWWQHHPRIVDALIAASWVAWAILPIGGLSVEALPTAPTGVLGGLIVGGVVGIVMAVAIGVLRRSRPVLLFVIATVVPLALLPFGVDLRPLATVYAIFAIAVYDSVRRAWIAGAVSYALTIVLCVLHLLTGAVLPPLVSDAAPFPTVVAYLIFDLLGLQVALLWGQNAGNRRRYVDALLERARVLEHERDQQAQLAALAERSRIARDVHDIVSHSLSVIVRLADGARAVLDADPPRAREAVAQIGGVARSSLDEMRRTIGVLERAPENTPLRSSTGIDDLPRLVDVYRGIGLPVELSIASEREREVPAGVQMTVFRVVQESLTNAMRHATAPTRVTVAVRVADDGVQAEIRDDGGLRQGRSATPGVHVAGVAAAGPVGSEAGVGRGLVGMRQRATLYGGTLDAGPVADLPTESRTMDPGRPSGWVVRLVLPEGES